MRLKLVCPQGGGTECCFKVENETKETQKMTLSSVQALSASVHARYEIKYSLKGCAHTLSDRTAT